MGRTVVEEEMKSGTGLLINFTHFIISYAAKTFPTLLQEERQFYSLELQLEISPHQQTFIEYVHRIRLDSTDSLRESLQIFKIKLKRED